MQGQEGGKQQAHTSVSLFVSEFAAILSLQNQMYSFQTATEETESSQKKGPWKILRLSLFLVSGHPVLHKHTYFPCFANQIASSFLFQSPIHLTWTGLFFFCLFKNRYTFSATLHLECVSIAPPCSRVLSNLQLICR